MRTLSIAVFATLLAIPSAGYSQDDRAPGPIGPNLEPLAPTPPSGSPLGAASPSQEQPR
jgi:hypothetical protein